MHCFFRLFHSRKEFMCLLYFDVFRRGYWLRAVGCNTIKVGEFQRTRGSVIVTSVMGGRSRQARNVAALTLCHASRPAATGRRSTRTTASLKTVGSSGADGAGLERRRAYPFSKLPLPNFSEPQSVRAACGVNLLDAIVRESCVPSVCVVLFNSTSEIYHLNIVIPNGCAWRWRYVVFKRKSILTTGLFISASNYGKLN